MDALKATSFNFKKAVRFLIIFRWRWRGG